MSREDSPLPTSSLGTLGTLFLVGRKTGIDVQSFPIDAERVTIGRDFDCDIRLYFSDVSKLHCEIIFDLLTNKATLHVHGSNGITYTPSGGASSHETPPTVLALSDKDTFMLRKKVFRFEYGVEESSSIGGYASPAPLSPAKQVRRRASHRLSLVPNGKSFVPQSPAKDGRRQSMAKNGPSKLSQVSQEEVLVQEEEEEEGLVNVVEGEGGDRVYLEMKEELEPVKPVFTKVFMTPQQKKKAPMRNTSAVPRTRKLPSTTQTQQEMTTKTPRSIPLPPSAETPYAEPASPSRVSPKVVMSTPKGDASLRKALLLRSARKVWQDTRSPGIEGAIERGDVEVRRKSLSPRVRATPKKDSSSSKSGSEEEEEEAEGHAGEEGDQEVEQEVEQEGVQGQLRWVHEDGTVEQNASFESDSADDSYEADLSLDIPGQSVIEFTDNKIEVEHGDEQQGEEWEDDLDEEGDEVGDLSPALPGTPAAARALSKFYTPQPRRALGQPRRSLASIGGPPVRFKQEFDAEPITKYEPQTPGSMGPPSRIRVQREQTPENNMEEMIEVKPTPAKTPITAAMRAEAKRRRDTLATPRALPLPPASGFRTLSRESPGINLMATPTHPALAPTSPQEENEHAGHEVPPTPMNDIRRRLSMLRRQSVNQPNNRRATVGFAIPATPSNKVAANANANYTVAAARTLAPMPKAPTMGPVRGTDSEVSSLQHTPVRPTTVSLQDVLPQRPEELTSAEVNGDLSDSVDYASGDISMATPTYTGLKQMLHQPLPPKTPHFAGLKNLFPEATTSQTPALDGVRQLLTQHNVLPPKTPNFVGMKDMYAQAKVLETPGMEGVADMYELFEGEGTEEEGEINVEAGSPVVRPLKAKGSRAAAAGRKKAPAPEQPETVETLTASQSKSKSSARSVSSSTRGKSAVVEEPAVVPTKVPAKRGRSAKSASSTQQESTSVPAKTPRSRKATVEVEEPKQFEVEQEEEPSQPSKRQSARSRSTRAKTEAAATPAPAEAEADEQKQPSKINRGTSRSKRVAKVEVDAAVLGDLDEQVQVPVVTEEDSKPVTTKGRKSTTKAATISEGSAPVARTKAKAKQAVEDKENEPVVEKAPAKRTVTTKGKSTATPASERASTRTTRSRK